VPYPELKQIAANRWDGRAFLTQSTQPHILRVLRPERCFPLLLIEAYEKRVAMLQHWSAKEAGLFSHQIEQFIFAQCPRRDALCLGRWALE